MPGGSLSIGSFNAGSFVVNLGANYLLSRLSAQDGPRLGNLKAGGGHYGVGIPRLYGERVRITGEFLAQADIKERRHTVEDHSEIVGAVTGAVQGFMIGGPVGAVVGGVIGGLLGAATPNQHYYTYDDTLSFAVADRTGQNPVEGLVKIIAAGKTIFNGGDAASGTATYGPDGRVTSIRWGKNRYCASVTLFTGHGDQPVSSVLAAAVGEDGQYPFTAHVVLEKLQLAEFGNSVPECDQIVAVRAGETFADVIEDISGRAGIDPARDLSSTAMAGDVCRGYAVTGDSSCWDAINPLLPVIGCDAAEVGGQLRFNKRLHGLRATVPAEALGAHAYGDTPPPAVQFKRDHDLKLPQETSLTFIDPARDYQTNTATSARTEGDARSNVSVNINLVLTADEGASAAALMHWDAWLGRTAVALTLTDAWVGVEVGRAYAIPFAGQHVPYRFSRRTRGANGLIEVEGLSDEAVTYTAAVAGAAVAVESEDTTLLPDTRLILMDMPILEDAHDDYGFYAVMAGSASYWTRGQVQLSSDGVTYGTLIDRALSTPAMGDVTGVLGAGPTDGLDDTLDAVSVLTVVLLHDGMELASVTDAELDAFKNFAFVGKDGQGEYLQFKTATQVGPKTWQLTNLRRGRKGTDWAIGGHGAGEEFALLGDSGVFRVVYGDSAAWGDDLFARGVTLHQDVEDAAVQAFVNTGEGKRPYAPVDVAGSWNGSNDVTVSWTGRSRMNSGAAGIDDRDEYEIELFEGGGVTRIVPGAETTTFTAAQQAGAGIVPGASISGRVRQTSDVYDGRWRSFAFNGPITRRADTTSITADSNLETADMA